MNLFDLYGKISLDGTGFNSAIDTAMGAAKGLVAAIGAATGAVAAFAGSSVKVGMEFDKSMSQVAATMGTTVDNIQGLRDFAMEMGSSTAFSASEAADALNYMALAGYDAQQSMDMLPNVLNLAAAGSIELAAASDMITDSQSALGLTMEQTTELVDQMAKTASKSNTSVEQLGEAILTVGGTAKSLAGGTDELNAVLGVMADNGIKGAEAGTHLRNIMLAMNPTTEAASEAFKELGVKAYDSNGNLRNLEQVFLEMGEAMDGMTDQEKTNIISSIFNKTDISSVNALLSTNAGRWRELNRAIDNADGAAEAMADTQLDNLAGDVTMFQSALEGAQILISDGITPDLRDFVQFGTNAIGTLSDAFRDGGLSGAMDALGTILSDGIAMVVEKLPEFVGAGTELLVSLVGGIVQNFPILMSAAGEIVTTVINTLSENGPQLLSSAEFLLDTITSGLVDSLPALIPAAVGIIMRLTDKLTDPESIGSMVDTAIELIFAIADGLIKALPILLQQAPVIVENLVRAVINNAPKLLQAAAELIGKLVMGIVNSLPKLGQSAGQIIGTLVSGMSQLFSRITDVGKNIVSGLWNGIKEKWSWLKDQFTGLVNGLVGGVKNVLGIHSPSRVFAGIGGFMAQGLGEGWEDEFPSIRNAIKKDLAFESGDIGIGLYGDAANRQTNRGGVTVIQNIYAQEKTAAEQQAAARWEYERAVLMA